jgi:superfamily I DNA/RNA helicase
MKSEENKKLPYSVIVLDEYQDVNKEQFELIETIRDYCSKTEDVKIIAT